MSSRLNNSPALFLFIVVIVFTAYGLYRYPFRKCRRCKGSGELRSSLTKAFRFCPTCEGSGRRYRLGARRPKG